MKLTEEQIDGLEDHASRLRNHIAKIRIDFPEAADARRSELHDVYRKIAAGRQALEAREGRE